VGAAAALWFLTNYVSSAKDPAALIGRAGELLVYALAFCGSAAGFGSASLGALNIVFVSVSATLGAILIGLAIYAATRGGLGKGRIALWINLFIFATAFATAVSRIDFGLQQALVPRYHINSCLMITATLIALLDLDEADPIRRFVQRSMAAFAVIAAPYAVGTTPILLMIHKIDQAPPV